MPPSIFGGSPDGAARWFGPCKVNWAAGQGISNAPADVSGGTFTLTINGQTTAAIAWNATAAQVLAAVNALPSINGAAIFDVTNVWTDINAPGQLDFKDATATGLATINATNLTGPSAPYTITVGTNAPSIPLVTPAVGDLIIDFFHEIQTAFNDSGPLRLTYGDNPADQSAPNWAAPVSNPIFNLDTAQEAYTNFGGANNADRVVGISSAWTMQAAKWTYGGVGGANDQAYSTLPARCKVSAPVYSILTNGHSDGTTGEVWIWVLVATPAPMAD